MIYKENKEITGVYRGDIAISAVYKGDKLVWQAVRSCYGSGAWLNERPWLDDDPWKN